MSEKKTGINFQYFGTIAAMVISSLALMVSVYEASILKSQQEAMVWPYVKIDVSYSAEGFTIAAYNNGIGPALINSMEVSYNGEAVKDYLALLDLLKPDRNFGYNIIQVGQLNDTVLKAGERRLLLFVPFTPETEGIHQQLQYVNCQLQYSSVLGKNWKYDFQEAKVTEGKFIASLEFNQ